MIYNPIEIVGKFFKDLAIDCKMIVSGEDRTRTERNWRMEAVAYRIIGLWNGGAALYTVVKFSTVSPLLAVGLVTISSVLAHDYLIMGRRIRERLEDQGPVDNFCTALIVFLQTKIYAPNPQELQGTWLLKPIYNLCYRMTAGHSTIR